MNYNGAEGLEFGDGNNRVDPAVLAGNNDCLQGQTQRSFHVCE